MKITASSDWRDSLAFDAPTVVSEIAPGEDTRCSVCGPASDARPRTELWALKHRHPTDHAGYVRFYCTEHLPVIDRKPAAAKTAKANAARAERKTATRRPMLSDAPLRALCPNCFVETSAKGLCGICGTQL
ncbi:glucose-6-phosphate dehydrogenase [Microbacterium lacus]|uniref:glucose-6-phosphate dehydrogenase n=1 Tax=Microbacterium lacus TaxID=415217 RepID=UPI00384BB3E9